MPDQSLGHVDASRPHTKIISRAISPKTVMTRRDPNRPPDPHAHARARARAQFRTCARIRVRERERERKSLLFATKEDAGSHRWRSQRRMKSMLIRRAVSSSEFSSSESGSSSKPCSESSAHTRWGLIAVTSARASSAPTAGTCPQPQYRFGIPLSLSVVETVPSEDDRECSGKPRTVRGPIWTLDSATRRLETRPRYESKVRVCSVAFQIFLILIFNFFKEITYLGAHLRPKSASRAGRSYPMMSLPRRRARDDGLVFC